MHQPGKMMRIADFSVSMTTPSTMHYGRRIPVLTCMHDNDIGVFENSRSLPRRQRARKKRRRAARRRRAALQGSATGAAAETTAVHPSTHWQRQP
jgi:hypothetical protein